MGGGALRTSRRHGAVAPGWPSHRGFVHPTAGTNDCIAAEVPAIIRGIYVFHATDDGGETSATSSSSTSADAPARAATAARRTVIVAHTTGANGAVVGVSLEGNFENANVAPAAFRPLAT